MKKINTLLSVLLLLPCLAEAQDNDEKNYGFDKENVFVSGSISYGSRSRELSDDKAFFFSPQVGYFVSSNITLEGGFIFGRDTQDAKTSPSFFEDTVTGLNLGSRYFFSPDKQFSFTLGLLGTYYKSKREALNQTTNQVVESSFKTTEIELAPGINYFVSEHFIVQMSAGSIRYRRLKFDENAANPNSVRTQFSTIFDLSGLRFGLTYKF